MNLKKFFLIFLFLIYQQAHLRDLGNVKIENITETTNGDHETIVTNVDHNYLS